MPAKKTAAKKTAAKKTAAKKTVAKKTAAKETAAKKTAQQTATTTKTAKAGPQDLAEQGALEAGAAAFGLTMLKRGFCHTPEDDRWFALGYPSVVVLTDEVVADKYRATIQTWSARFTRRGGRWPRAAVEPSVRAFLAEGNANDELEALSRTAPLTDDEVKRAIQRAVPGFLGGAILLLLESVVGTQRVVRGAVDLLEAATNQAWSRGTIERNGAHTLWHLHFMLLRLAPGDRDQALTRLRRIEKRLEPEGRDGMSRAHETLDMLLNGSAALVRNGNRDPDRIHLTSLAFAQDDPAFVLKHTKIAVEGLKPADRGHASSRAAWIAGAEGVQVQCDAAKQFHSSSRDEYVDEFGRFKHPAVKKMMTTIAAGSGSPARAAKAWLAAHA